jgi:hypothetical protein
VGLTKKDETSKQKKKKEHLKMLQTKSKRKSSKQTSKQTNE